MKNGTLIPSILRQKRELCGLSVESVVSKLKDFGITISEKALYAYENGTNSPKVNTFIALCKIYNVSDIMSEFGYSSVPLVPAHEDWTQTQYNDFFNIPFLDKLYFVIRNGVPSFDGYEEQLEDIFPSDADAANFNKLYNLFMQLNEAGQGAALLSLKDLLKDPDFAKSSQSDLKIG